MKPNTQHFLPLTAFSVLLVLLGCFGSVRKDGEAVPEEIFFDFVITGEEGNDTASLVMKFKEYDESGGAVSIEPGKVTLDGLLVPVDSTLMTGPFYAVHKHIREFAGKHQVEVIFPNNKKYRNEISFLPFAIRSGLNDTLTRNRMEVQFSGLSNNEIIRLLMTDTSFTGEGINRVDTVWYNRISVTRNELTKLGNGPVNLEITREGERPLRNTPAAGGKLRTYYSIRRELWLKDR